MPSLEEVGRVLDGELSRLRRFLVDEVTPSTLRAAVETLRNASSRLEELAQQLETQAKSKDAGSH